MIPNQDFKVMSLFSAEYFRNDYIYDHCLHTMEWEPEIVFKLSNGIVFNDLEWPLTRISRSQLTGTQYAIFVN